jgi:hypothetical protein
MSILNEFEYTVKEILFGNESVYNIDLNWCTDLSVLVMFVRKTEFELIVAKLKIKEQVLILNNGKYEWIIKIDRKVNPEINNYVE